MAIVSKLTENYCNMDDVWMGRDGALQKGTFSLSNNLVSSASEQLATLSLRFKLRFQPDMTWIDLNPNTRTFCQVVQHGLNS